MGVNERMLVCSFSPPTGESEGGRHLPYYRHHAECDNHCEKCHHTMWRVLPYRKCHRDDDSVHQETFCERRLTVVN